MPADGHEHNSPENRAGRERRFNLDGTGRDDI